MNHKQSPNHRRGVTLVELVASLLGASVLVAGLSSATFIALQVSNPALTPARGTLAGAAHLTEMQTELQFALSVLEKTSQSITVTVPDRNGDGSPETIRYAWSGTPGEPLTRQFNGGTVLNFAENVQEFQLTFDTKTLTRAGAPNVVEGSETLLVGNSSAFFLWQADLKIIHSQPGGQYFAPSLPANTSSWKVTRVRIRALKTDSPLTDTTNVELHPAGADLLPTSSVVETHALAESSLSTSYSWREISFDGVSGLLPSQSLCLLLTTSSTNGSCMVQYDVFEFLGGLLRPNGSSWLRESLQSLMFEVYGTVTTTTPTTVNVSVVTGLNLRLSLGTSTNTRVETAVQCLNLPENPS